VLIFLILHVYEQSLSIAYTFILFHILLPQKGIVNGYPRFVEQNKVDGSPYKEIIPAEIIYCLDIKSWVFWHPNIKTSPPDKPEFEVS
jgi:hypothetical protein